MAVGKKKAVFLKPVVFQNGFCRIGKIGIGSQTKVKQTVPAAEADDVRGLVFLFFCEHNRQACVAVIAEIIFFKTEQDGVCPAECPAAFRDQVRVEVSF